MRVLVACEFSGIVREAFKEKGHDAWSCDLLPTEIPGQHIQDDVLKHLNNGWDLMIAHPPCTYITVSNSRNFYKKEKEHQAALEFVVKLMNTDINKICIENPVSAINTRIKKPTQIIHPWQFGHPEQKRTCLWLWELPNLQPTNIVPLPSDPKERQRILYTPGVPTHKKAHERSRTYQGIANAMAEQWG